MAESDRSDPHELPTPGQRFLYAETRQPITVRHIQPELSSDGSTHIGIEFDDARAAPAPISSWWVSQPGAGHNLRWERGKTLFVPGITLVDALEERYGPLDETAPPQAPSQTAPESVVLGSSNAAIVVEAPGMEGVRRRMARLERRREIGFDGEWVARLGGSERQRELFKQRLKGVRVLDLSRNLVETWGDMAEIVEHLPGLTTLIINRSRIAPIPQDAANEFAEKYRAAFLNITDLHMGSGVERWDEVIRMCRMFPNLKTLDLHNGIRLDSLGAAHGVLDGLTSLNLDNCPLHDWDHLAEHLTALPALEALSLAGTPLRPKPIPRLHGTPFPALRRLSLEGTRIERYRWRDIDHLANWVPLLENLRISCDVHEAADATPEFNALFMSGEARTDRPYVIAKLRNLTMLNGTPVSPAERLDAELYYLRSVNNLGLAHPAASWGRFEELVELHGPAQKDAPRQTTLKSRLISLTVVPPSGFSFQMGILPSAPVSLLEKKIAKKLSVPAVTVWTARKHEAVDGVWEPVEALEDGREVGRYVTDGDTVVVVL